MLFIEILYLFLFNDFMKESLEVINGTCYNLVPTATNSKLLREIFI